MAEQFLLEDENARDRQALLSQMSGAGPNRPTSASLTGGIGAGMAQAAGSIAGALREKPEAPSMAAPPAESASPYQAKGPAMGLEGFDTNKLSSGHVSPKYVFAKHAQGLGVNDRDELLRRLQADESGYFKNAKWGGNKGDILEVGGELDPKFEGISKFDVIRAMGEGGKGWQWGDASGGQADGGPAAAVGRAAGMIGAGPSSFQGIQSLVPTDTSAYNTLQAKLQELLGGPQAMDREALLRMMVK